MHNASVESPPPLFEELTPLELRVLELAAQGYASAEIAQRLSYSVKWIQNVRGGVQRKLGSRNMTEAVVMAWRSGLIRRTLRRQ